MTEAWVDPVEYFVTMVTPEDMGEPENDPFATTITFDPGGITGWCVLCVWPEALHLPEQRILANVASWSAGEFAGSSASQVDQMMALVEAWGDNSHVLWEDFILMKFTMARDLLLPVRVAARFEDRMYVAGREAQIREPQLASIAMRTVTDERLKAWGYWNPLRGKEHARDAVRHAITYVRRLKQSNLDAARAVEKAANEHVGAVGVDS